MIRADASLRIGTGHVRRCLTLAQALKKRGAEATFICRELDGNLCDFIGEQGFCVYRLPHPNTLAREDEPFGDSGTSHADWLEVPWCVDATQTGEVLRTLMHIDWLVIDHYALARRWERSQRSYVKRILALDSLADRPHDCDLLLDQDFAFPKERYAQQVPAGCTLLLGPEYVLLREAFQKVREALRPRSFGVERILLFFGGVDSSNESAKALSALRRSHYRDAAVDLVIGATNPHRGALAQEVETMPNVTLHVQVDQMAVLMSRADLAICAGGSFVWEALCLGLPCLVVSTADNQNAMLARLAERGCIYALGAKEHVDSKAIAEALALAQDGDVLKTLSQRALDVVDGHGAARVTRAMETLEAYP